MKLFASKFPASPKNVFLSIFISLAVACAPADEPGSTVDPTVILISIDGLRYDYIENVSTPTFDHIAKNGVKAESLVPVFPSKTFPNHFTQVTGLFPENHGLISNNMFDPVDSSIYRIGQGSSSVLESKWYQGEPIWVTVELQNKTAASYFWPGSEAEIKGKRPTYYEKYDGSIPNKERVDQVIRWLELPTESRPQFITLYMSLVDDAGHRHGPDSNEAREAVAEVDKQLKYLIDGLHAHGLDKKVNIIVVSDHGMTQMSRDKTIFIDDYINIDDYHVIDRSPIFTIRLPEEKIAATYDSLVGKNPNLDVFTKENIPERLHYSKYRLIPDIICVPREGYMVTSHEYFDSHPMAYTGGMHGYDFIYPSMHGIFYAIGPDFKSGYVGESFQSIHLYELMCKILEIEPAENDGDLTKTTEFLKIP